ncbi:MAG: hypothetical protein HOK57_00470 [Planctomycetaceae bacterium]|jgi:hypothetical protein|nr:hypothetical protein [Planctomycetaceae bacterium]
MNFAALVRLAVFLAVIGYVFNGPDGPDRRPDKPVVVEDYNGRLVDLNRESRSMSPEDRAAMSEGFQAGADMLRADAKGLLDTSFKLQTYCIALLEFNYNGNGKPQQKYPGVSAEVQKEFVAVIGDDSRGVDATDRIKLADSLAEMAKAVR